MNVCVCVCECFHVCACASVVLWEQKRGRLPHLGCHLWHCPRPFIHLSRMSALSLLLYNNYDQGLFLMFVVS